MESIFIGMISIKYQLTWSLSHAWTASRVNVHLISQCPARLQGNDSEGPLVRGPGHCMLQPFGLLQLPSLTLPTPCAGHRFTRRVSALPAGGGGRASVFSSGPEAQAAQPGRAGRCRPGQRARGCRAVSARPPSPARFRRLLASAHRRGERGRRCWGGSGQGWAGFFSCLRSGTCKLKPKVPPELMSVCVCVCARAGCCVPNRK